MINKNNKAILIFNNESTKKNKTLPNNTKSLLKSINILEDKIKYPINIISDNNKIITPKINN